MLASGLAWTVGATAAVAVGLIALSLIGPGLGVRPLDSLSSKSGNMTVAQPLPTTGVPSVGITNSPSGPQKQPPNKPAGPSTGTSISATHATPSPSDPVRLLTSPGGTVVAVCTAGGVYLVSWSPAQNYGIHEVRRGPTTVAHVSFDSRRDTVTVWVDCFNGGLPQSHIDIGPPPPGHDD